MTDLSKLPAAAAALAAAVRATATGPADQVRVLLRLADVSGDGPVARLLRRSALVELARACAAYQPDSYDDAQALLTSVCSLLDAEVLRAGDSGDDAAYVAFRALRLAVATDLRARGDALPRLRRVRVLRSVPAEVLAHGLYGDARRGGELVRRADPVHPLFMPLDLTVLAS